MKKKNDSILNTQCSDKWIFSRLPQWSAGDLFQTGIQVLRLTRISFSTIYWGEENRRFPSYENAISVWFKHHFPTGQLQVRGEFRHDNEGGYWYQEENRAGFIGQAGKQNSEPQTLKCFFSETYTTQEFSESHQMLTLTSRVCWVHGCVGQRTAWSCDPSPHQVRRAVVCYVPEITIIQDDFKICFPRFTNV